MTFHDERFPTKLSLGSIGGPERRTEIVTVASGYEERNSPWKHSRRRFDAGVAMRSLDDMNRVVSFFEARKGRLYGFRWKDWSDFKSCEPSKEVTPFDQKIINRKNSSKILQLCKNYTSGDYTYCREIHKPVDGSIRIAIDGVEIFLGTDFSVDIKKGIISFQTDVTSKMKVTAGFEFDVPVRFDTDRLEMTVAGIQAGEVPNVPVIEVRV